MKGRGVWRDMSVKRLFCRDAPENCRRRRQFLPADIIPEELHGPCGYVDDIWLCAYVADAVWRQLGDEAILTENWEGEAPLMPLIHEVLDKESDPIGDERERILGYTGCAQLAEQGT